jgi:ribulose-5-phosphate 4-epimerase/fuculose-1-phosphate aldolase
MDDTPTVNDWASHGLVAYQNGSDEIVVITVTLEGSAIGGLLRLQAQELMRSSTDVAAEMSCSFLSTTRL